jgi:hypothetical protein
MENPERGYGIFILLCGGKSNNAEGGVRKKGNIIPSRFDTAFLHYDLRYAIGDTPTRFLKTLEK